MIKKPFAPQLLCALACAVLFSSCSKTPESSTNVSATPAPEAKMEGQSANWKLTVVSVDNVPKQDSFMPVGPEMQGPENKHDTLQLTVEAVYIGSSAELQSPSATLIDSSGRNAEAAKASLVTPGAIYSISFGPGFSSLETMFTGETGAPSVEELKNEQKDREVKDLLYWLDPRSVATYKKKPRPLKNGEKFSAIYYFQDPKDYTDLKFAFNDVPPIKLKAPQAEANAAPSSQPSQSTTPATEFRVDAQNNDWKLMVTSVKKIPNDTMRSHDPRDSLEVALDVEYVGPVRPLKPPTASLVDGHGKKYVGDITSTSVMEWVFPGSPDISLKPGVTVSVTFSFKDPGEYTDLKLVFNDVPPFSLKAP